VLQYRPSNDPIDYWVAYQAGFALRLFELPPQSALTLWGPATARRRCSHS
jgi:hypothetical protein